MNNTFKDDLKRGIDIELQVLNIIQKKYPSASLINKFKGYDIWIPELHKSIEVKSDLKSNYTNNIVIEIEMFGKPSGLMVTKADYWVFYDGNQYVLIQPMEIVRCIFLNKLNYVEFIGNGDTASKKAFLVKKDILFKYGKIINND
jgi:hypothetical protein